MDGEDNEAVVAREDENQAVKRKADESVASVAVDTEQPVKKRILSAVSSASVPPFRTMRSELGIYRPRGSRENEQLPEGDSAPPKQEADPKLKQRNQRLLGVLMGTLQRAKDDREKEVSSQDAVVSRQREMTKKIEEKVEAERTELQAQYRATIEEKRKQRIEAEQELRKKRREESECRVKERMDTEEKRLNEYYEQQRALSSKYILTTTYPPVAYLPVQHTDATTKLLEQQKSNPVVQRTAARAVVRSAVSVDDGSGDAVEAEESAVNEDVPAADKPAPDEKVREGSRSPSPARFRRSASHSSRSRSRSSSPSRSPRSAGSRHRSQSPVAEAVPSKKSPTPERK